WIQSPNLRISITELSNKLEELADKYPIPLNAPLLLDDKELDLDGKKNQTSAESLFPEFDDPDIIDEYDIIVSIEDGIKMHRNGDHQGAWKSFEQNSVLPLAKFWQGYYYSNGHVVAKNVGKARQLFKEAADDNHPESQYRYA
ncbi:4596_t:CDS:1, partial [Dentiscutata heterogama]